MCTMESRLPARQKDKWNKHMGQKSSTVTKSTWPSHTWDILENISQIYYRKISKGKSKITSARRFQNILSLSSTHTAGNTSRASVAGDTGGPWEQPPDTLHRWGIQATRVTLDSRSTCPPEFLWLCPCHFHFGTFLFVLMTRDLNATGIDNSNCSLIRALCYKHVYTDTSFQRSTLLLTF